ncbi:MAG: DUF4330 family protein [Evtepia sp.]
MIDKKGKLFGKLNIIDLLAILLIVAVLALIGYKLVQQRRSRPEPGRRLSIPWK